MNGANENTASRLDSQLVETRLKLAGAFIVIGDAGDAARRLYILGQHTRKLDRKCFCFAATGTCEDDTVPRGLICSPLTSVFPKTGCRTKVKSPIRHVRLRT